MPKKASTFSDRIDSWKAIANHFKRGVRTVRLWERQECLPVHRFLHHRRSSVYAFRAELDAWLLNRRPRQSKSARQTLALIPIRDLGGAPDLHLFAAGLTEELITQLARPGRAPLTVVAGSENDPRQAVPRYALVVSGSVRASGDQLRVTVRLSDARHGTQLWANAYQLSAHASLAGQVLVASTIVSELAFSMPSHARASNAAIAVPDPVRELCFEGRRLWKQRTISTLRQAIECFENALDLQPAYAQAYSGLADCYTLLGYYSRFPLSQAQVCATRAARRALELDAELGEAHASMAEIKAFHEWDWAGSDMEFQRAIALDSKYATAYLWYANLLAILGRTDAAESYARKASELEPDSPLIMTGVGLVQLYCNRADTALEFCERALQIDPNYVLGYWALGLAYECIGDREEAINQFQNGKRRDSESTCIRTSLAHTLATLGDQEQAREILQDLAQNPERGREQAYDVALVHAGLNDPDNVFRWLERAREERSDWLPYLAVEHRFASLRHDVRYSNLLAHLGLN
jgi:TolB-like protein/Tfp pilus assembly protein PilF